MGIQGVDGTLIRMGHSIYSTIKGLHLGETFLHQQGPIYPMRQDNAQFSVDMQINDMHEWYLESLGSLKGPLVALTNGQ